MIEIATGVFVKRHEELDLNLGLVVGDRECLVIDTGLNDAFAADVRKITPLPWRVVLTHNHWDHVLGTPAFLPCEIWAHENCTVDEEILLGDAKNYPELIPVDPVLVPPTHTFKNHKKFDLGGRTVELHHFGPSHTSHDVVVHVPDVDVVFAGDVVEIGAPVQFGPDATPENWPNVIEQIKRLAPAMVVPGHGTPTAEWT
ncbi:MBL fold metallo-hydrolase [Lentzea sp. NBRC 105346]|uniref:MBL fold metallo-hydrolase n=1 Tax=Lentzea sp. NBRC 105346 TaxID=3032205 RepID=UPI00249FBCC1|nr:MBL fold metallo-hydrolase [Lentzea sp. NBRC 105346]GLZ34926.1 MBL fold metallo-hydrolase [Lentzea sp. NBRC 105346]